MKTIEKVISTQEIRFIFQDVKNALRLFHSHTILCKKISSINHKEKRAAHVYFLRHNLDEKAISAMLLWPKNTKIGFRTKLWFKSNNILLPLIKAFKFDENWKNGHTSILSCFKGKYYLTTISFSVLRSNISQLFLHFKFFPNTFMNKLNVINKTKKMSRDSVRSREMFMHVKRQMLIYLRDANSLTYVWNNILLHTFAALLSYHG